jgi:hypothetical protein
MPLNNAHLGPFPLFTLSAPTIIHDQTPQPTPISLTCLQPPPRQSCPTCGYQFTFQGLVHH